MRQGSDVRPNGNTVFSLLNVPFLINAPPFTVLPVYLERGDVIPENIKVDSLPRKGRNAADTVTAPLICHLIQIEPKPGLSMGTNDNYWLYSKACNERPPPRFLLAYARRVYSR